VWKMKLTQKGWARLARKNQGRENRP